MKAKYLASLFISSAVIFGLSAMLLFLAVRHKQFRESIGHDQPAFERFVAKVESGSLKPETMAGFTNSWFLALKQDHRMIQVEEQVSDRLAGRLTLIGSFGLLVVLFQTYLMFSLWKHLRHP